MWLLSYKIGDKVYYMSILFLCGSISWGTTIWKKFQTGLITLKKPNRIDDGNSYSLGLTTIYGKQKKKI